MFLAIGLISNVNATTFISECQDENYLFNNSELVIIGTVSDIVESGKYVIIDISKYTKGSYEKQIKIRNYNYEPTGPFIPGFPTYSTGEKVKLYLYKDSEGDYDVMCGEFGKKSLEPGPVTPEDVEREKGSKGSGGAEEVKIMPDTASERAIEIAKMHYESVELKDTGKHVFYEVKGNKDAKLFGFIPIKMKIIVLVDAQNGDVLEISKPGWSFLAKSS